MPNLADIGAFLNIILDMDRYPAEERGTIFVSSARPIRRIGLALEPWPTMPSWLEHEDLDAIFLYRVTNLDRDTVPPTRGVIYAHLPFEERMTVGYVPRLAEVLGLRARSPMGDKGGRPLGMIGELPKPLSAIDWRRVVTDIYGGTEDIWDAGQAQIRKVAIVNTMTPALVQEAANRGAVQAYLTTQLREPAHAACKASNISAYSVGQRRAQLSGLRTLAGMIRERWAGVRTAVFEDRGQ